MVEINNILVILAAGKGIRFGSETPKQYVNIGGHELLQIGLDEMRQSELADKLIVVLDDAVRINNVKQKYSVDAIMGGKDRAHSFQNALDHIKKYYPTADKVVFHESARPLVKASDIDMYFKLLDKYDYVETCSIINDSLGSYTIKAPKRDDYYLIQAPEAYRIDVLEKYFDCESDIYFAANQFPDICKGYQNFDMKYNIKLTNKEDKVIIEALMDCHK